LQRQETGFGRIYFGSIDPVVQNQDTVKRGEFQMQEFLIVIQVNRGALSS
jgi:hypothetical protein